MDDDADGGWVDEVLGFWFSGNDDDRMRRWWRKDDAVDAAIRERFADLSARAVAGELDDEAEDPWSCLALVILLDQMPRNMYRGTARMFAGDARARELAAFAVDEGFVSDLDLDERLFLTIPFEHSESLADQERLLALMDAWADDDLPDADKLGFYREFAVKHRDIIARFGRFPHRNEALGRASTEEERAFLEEPGSSF